MLDPLIINGQTRDVRIFRLNDTFHGDDTAWIAEINEILGRVSFAADAIGSRLTIKEVSILLADHLADGEDVGAHAVTRVPSGLPNGECPIVFYKNTAALSTAEFGKVLAHELFHCIQGATWGAATATEAATWWVEGSAEYFAQLVVPESTSTDIFISEFGQRGPTTSLYDDPMDYETVVFFDWLHAHAGGEGVVTFLNGIQATGGGLAGLQSLVSDADWVEMIETYAANQLTEPGGRQIHRGDAEQLDVSQETEEFAYTTDAYRGLLLELRFPETGRYEISVAGSASLRAKINRGGPDWMPVPFEINACTDETPALIYAVSTEGPEDFTLTYRRVDECNACERQRVRDACVAGNWTMTGGGAVEWMRANGMGNNAQLATGEMSMQMRRNGAFLTAPLTVFLDADLDGSPITGTSDGPGATGVWSAGDGVLNICPQTGGAQATISSDAGSQTMLFGPEGDLQMQYTCRGATLTTSLEIGSGMPPMETTYTRQ